MSFPGAISAGNITKCRGSYAGAQYLALVPNTVVLKATVNATSYAGGSANYLNLNAALSGAFGNVKADMRVLVGTVDDIRQAPIHLRARATMSGSTLKISETSRVISANDYVWVVDDYVLTDRLASERLGVQYKDWEIVYRGLPPVIYGLQSAYVGQVSGDPATFSVAFSPSAFAAESGATISSWLYVTPDGTVTAGALATATVTIAFPEGFRWVHLTCTDSGGRTMTRHIKVWAMGDTTTASLDFTAAQINHTIDGGLSLSASAWAGVSTILDDTSCVGYTREWYGSTEGPIVSNIKFCGRLRQVNAAAKGDLLYSNVQEAQWQIESVTEQLARLESLPRAIVPDSTPTVWDEINGLTVWRAVVYLLAEHSTFLNLHDLTFDSTATTFLIPQVGLQKGDLLRAVTDLISSINAGWEFAGSGESRIGRDLRYTTTAVRNAATTVYSFTSADWIDLTINIEPAITAAKVDASGGMYNSTTNYETPLLALSPGIAPLEGTEEIPFTRQYLTANQTAAAAQTELIQRSDDRLATELNKVTLQVTFPDNYHWITPSLTTWYKFTIAATDNLLGLAYTTSTRWLCTAVSQAWNNDTGTCDVSATFVIETTGSGGTAIEYPTQTELNLNLPDIPTFDPYADLFPTLPDLWLTDSATATDEVPETGAVVKRNGSIQILIDPSNARVYITLNALAASPTYRDITPTFAASETPRHVCFNPLSTGSSIGAYLLTSDGTNSWVWYSTDALAGDPAWTKGAALTGEYTVVRASNVAGTVLVYAPYTPGEGTTDTTYTVTFDAGGYNAFVVQNETTITAGGNPGNAAYKIGDCTGVTIETRVTVTLPAELTVTNTQADFKKVQPAYLPTAIQYTYYDADGNQVAEYNNTPNIGNSYVTAADTTDRTTVKSIRMRGGNTNLVATTVEMYMDNLAITATTPVVDVSSVVASTDYGATWGTVRAVGTTAYPYGAMGGFDVQVDGANSFASASNGVYRATTLGGAYTLYYSPTGSAKPTTVIVPYFNWAGTSQMAAANPDILVLFDLPDGSSRSGVWVEGGATPGTVHDLAVPAGLTFDNPDALTVLYAHHLACFGYVSGTLKIYTTNDQASTWVDRGAQTSLTYLRCRRGDNSASVSGTNKGQLFALANGVEKYAPDWGVTLKSRTPPGLCSKLDVWG